MDINYYKKYEPIFGEWRIVREIGEGSFGKVFEIEREDFGRTYKAALKAITIPQSQSELRSARMEYDSDESLTSYFHGFVKETVEEFALMSKLKGGNNIVSYEDHKVIEHGNGIGWDILIRMELLTPLMDWSRENPMSRGDIIKLGADMCRALERCKKLNIIHRDIKPENIFISEFGDFKLGDFGVARISERTVGGMSKKGTYNYMAPEVYRGERYGASVDIYSLGLVLYRLLNGNRAPFLPPSPALIKSSERESALMRRIGGEALPAPANADAELAAVILKACAYKPEDRYKSPTEMREALEAVETSGEAIPTVTEIHSAMSADGATVSMLGGDAAERSSSSEPADRDEQDESRTMGPFSGGSAAEKPSKAAEGESGTAIEKRIEVPDEEDTEATLKECTKGGYSKELSKQQNEPDASAAAALTKKDKSSPMLFFKEHKSVAGILACAIICIAMLAVVLSHGNTYDAEDPVITPLVTAEATEEVNNNEAEPEETEEAADASEDEQEEAKNKEPAVGKYTVSWSNGTGYKISVSRVSSKKAKAALGTLNSGAAVYEGDTLSVKYTADTGYTLGATGNSQITVSGNVTGASIFASATPNTYSYKVIYRSVNGTDLGSATVSNKYGTQNTVSAPSKNGYITPESQDVLWDKDSKTITFTYGVVSQPTNQFAASGWWFTVNYSSGTSYSASVEYQNRTAGSVQVRIVWTQNCTRSAYGFNQYFCASCGNQSTGNVRIADPSVFPYTSSSGPWVTKSVTVYSGWMTVPISATTTSVTVSCNWWSPDSDTAESGSWAKEMAIPAY